MSTSLFKRWEYLTRCILSSLEPMLISEANERFSTAWFTICQYYGEAHRSYHTLKHLEYMYTQAEKYGLISLQESNNFCHSLAIDFAIFFHDIIYDPKSKLNEQLSADLFKEYFEKYMPPTFVSTVVLFILATTNHMDNVSCDDDLKIFLDLDLSILGGTPLEYKNYAMQIRFEYNFVPEEVYCRERAKFLRNMLKGNIYRTSRIAEDKESQAHSNIEWECSILESGKLISDIS
mmetsp:Transcript_30847/g.44302  ORF Transcript_30847/g.44302 Transcript_30847/m.44302 type:complete len:234 (+) Transcript_30847:38-739(+)